MSGLAIESCWGWASAGFSFLPAQAYLVEEVWKFAGKCKSGLHLLLEALNDFMAWNLVLAVVPLLLAWWLFHVRRPRGPLWWLGAVLFVLFLPNAPYVLTDSIHFVDAVRRVPPLPLPFIDQVLIPEYAFFMFAGLQCYVISLILLRRYLERHGLRAWVLGVELSLHALCGVGMYLGRVLRFNSWDLFQDPGGVLSSALQACQYRRDSLMHMTTNVVVLLVLYGVFKFVDIAVLEHWKRRLNNRTEAKRHWLETVPAGQRG